MNEQVEVSNQEIKSILAIIVNANMTIDLGSKMMLCGSIKNFKTLISSFTYLLMYGKAIHLPIKLEYKRLWVLKKLNFEKNVATNLRMIMVNKLDEFRIRAYESLALYKENIMLNHDKKIEKKGV